MSRLRSSFPSAHARPLFSPCLLLTNPALRLILSENTAGKEEFLMSYDKVKQYFDEAGAGDKVLTFSVSSATVELAAKAVGCEPARIAKTMSFLTDDGPILIVTAGDVKIDNHKYKEAFHQKAKMIPREEVETDIGHAPGGVCPFAIKDGVRVFLDDSLKRFDVVYPAAGNENSAVRLTIPELEQFSRCHQWIDVCKTMQA